MKRYEKQIALPEIGVSGQQKLTNAKVLLIGVGGLGCPVLQNLVAAGVGTIGIVDGDRIVESNLNRQLLFSKKDCGKLKVDVARKKVLDQNPEVTVVSYVDYFSKVNALEIVSDYHVIVDCTDSIPTRYLINDVCLLKNIPMVYASLHKFEGQLSVFNYKNGPTYRCLFPENKAIEKFVDCNETGVLGILPNTLGILQATEVLKIILGIGEIISGRLLVYNALNFTFQFVNFSKNEQQVKIGIQSGNDLANHKNEFHEITSVAFSSEIQNQNTIIIDIRENHEMPKLIFPSIKLIPLHEVENYLSKFNKNQRIVFCCQHGNKSNMLVAYLTKKGYNNLHHLRNGVKSLENSYFY